MPLPTAPLLSEPRKQITEQESTFTDAEPTNDGISQNNGGDINNENKVENVVDTENNADECNNALNVKQNMDISTEEEVYKVKKDEIVAQVCTCINLENVALRYTTANRAQHVPYSHVRGDYFNYHFNLFINLVLCQEETLIFV